MDDSPEVISWLKGFRDLGIGLSIYDFGTGYSSLSYLKRFPVNVIKIDRAFVHGLPEDTGDASLVEAILAMGQSLGLSVVAEGVETKEQHSFLRKRNCDYLQGFYFGKPMPEAELQVWLEEQAKTAEK